MVNTNKCFRRIQKHEYSGKLPKVKYIIENITSKRKYLKKYNKIYLLCHINYKMIEINLIIIKNGGNKN
jgi:hypothetical protein